MAENVWLPSADLVTILIEINGTRIPDSYLVRSITTDQRINRIPGATVTIADGSRVEADFVASSADLFEPGGEITIFAGYHDTRKQIFSGLIVGQRLSVDASENSSLRVRCKDKAVKLTLARSAVQYYDASDSAVQTKILMDAGLSADVSSTGEDLPQQARSHATDWDFILSRAEANGHVVQIRNAKATISPPKFDPPAFKAVYGDAILDVELDLSADQQIGSTQASAWDPKTQTVLDAASSEPQVNSQGTLSGSDLSHVLGSKQASLLSPGVQTAQSLTTWANAHMLKARMARIRGHITVPGNPMLWAGTQIELQGLGKKFNGDAYISGVEHQISDGTWHSRLTFGLEADWFAERHRDVSPASASGLRPAAPGLDIATVLKTDEDPEGERRIKVAMPLRADGGQGVWVRLASPYATKDAGIVFLPEIGDEVVLGFLNGDPDAAILLGALHSSARPAPIVPDAENTIKTITTRARHKVSFDDDRKIITIQTPGGHSVEMSDEDQSITITDSNENTLEMSASGIKMTSPKDITISAEGSIKMDGATGVVISSDADVSVKGANVSLSADMQMSATGSGSAELSSTGNTAVKGALVNIN